MMDFHILCETAAKTDPDYDKNNLGTAKDMKQLADAIHAGKFADADAFLAGLKKVEAGNGN